MNILPRKHFVSSMIPLSLSDNYWDKSHSSISQFIWNRKCPHVKLSTTQRGITNGGLSVPNPKLEVLFANISIKHCQLHFSVIISQLIQTWHAAEIQCKISCKWHTLTPIFNNMGLLIAGRPISCSAWSSCNVHTLGDIYNDSGLNSFQDIRDTYNLPASSFFFLLAA